MAGHRQVKRRSRGRTTGARTRRRCRRARARWRRQPPATLSSPLRPRHAGRRGRTSRPRESKPTSCCFGDCGMSAVDETPSTWASAADKMRSASLLHFLGCVHRRRWPWESHSCQMYCLPNVLFARSFFGFLFLSDESLALRSFAPSFGGNTFVLYAQLLPCSLIQVYDLLRLELLTKSRYQSAWALTTHYSQLCRWALLV